MSRIAWPLKHLSIRLSVQSKGNSSILELSNSNSCESFRTFVGAEPSLATASWDGTARLWSLDGQMLQEFGHQEGDLSVSFSPDGHSFSHCFRKTARSGLWSLDGQMLQEFFGHQEGALSVNFSPDGMFLATASEDGNVRLWTIATLEELLVSGCDRVRPYLEDGRFTDEYGPELCESIGTSE